MEAPQDRRCDGEDGGDVPSGRSKGTHHLHNRNEAVFISFDIETAGEQVGIVQISAEIFCLDLVRNKNLTGKNKGKVNHAADSAENIRCDPEVFDEYVRPESEHEWCRESMALHKLHPCHPSILQANNMCTVWNNFVSWVQRKISVDETGILVAWNRESCDLK